jgi:hypothetical protein
VEAGAWNIYLFGLFLALLSLPAITSVSLGEYSVNSAKDFVVKKALPLELFERQDRAAAADRLLCFASTSAYGCTTLAGSKLSIFSWFLLCHVPVWPALGAQRSASAMPCVHAGA